MRLSEVLRAEHILVPLTTETLRGAVIALVQRLVETGAVARPDRLERLLTEERIRDVVHVGERVLLPHLRTDAVDRLVVAIGISPEPLKARTSQQERGQEQIVVFVLAPRDSTSHYLQVVAALARALRGDTTVERLASARSPVEVLEIPEIRDLTVQPKLAVRDVMTARVFRVYPDTSAAEVLDLMRRHQVKAVPVVGEKREVLGVVTDRDILRHLMPVIGRFGAGDSQSDADRALLETPVRDIMARNVMCISEDQALSEVVTTMINKDVERLPVVHEGKLTGFLTRADVLRKLFPT